jgi:hypothetical protein
MMLIESLGQRGRAQTPLPAGGVRAAATHALGRLPTDAARRRDAHDRAPVNSGDLTAKGADRVDPNTPIEDTVGALAELVSEGKVLHIGLRGGPWGAGPEMLLLTGVVWPVRAGRLLERVALGRLGDLARLGHLRQSRGSGVAVGV